MKFEVISRIPWDSIDPDGRQVQGTPKIGYSNSGLDVLDFTRPHCRLEPGPEGKLLLLYPPDRMWVWDMKSRALMRYSLGTALDGSATLVDFTLDPSGMLYILTHSVTDDQLGLGMDRFQKLSPEGRLVWEKSQEIDLKATRFKPLLRQLEWCDDGLMLVEVAKRTVVHRVDPLNGDWQAIAHLEADYEDLCFDGRGHLYYVSYESTSGLRKWVQYAIDAQSVESKVGDSAAYPYLVFPKAANALGDGYFYFGNTFARFDVAQGAMHTLALSNVLLDAGGRLVLVHDDGQKMWLEYADDKSKVALFPNDDLPALEARHGVAKWQLVAMESKRWVFRGFSSGQNRYLYCDYSAENHTLAGQSYTLEDQRDHYHLQPPRTWAVTGDRKLLLPVSGPKDLLLVEVEGW